MASELVVCQHVHFSLFFQKQIIRNSKVPTFSKQKVFLLLKFLIRLCNFAKSLLVQYNINIKNKLV